MRFKHEIFWQLLTWSIWLGFTVLFLLPTEYLNEDVFDWWDKLQHALAFSTLTQIAHFAYPSKLFQISVALLIYGGLIEILQSLTGWRQGDVGDWLADGIGVLICSLLILVHRRIRKQNFPVYWGKER